MLVTDGAAAGEAWLPDVSGPAPSNDIGGDAGRAPFGERVGSGLVDALQLHLRGHLTRALTTARVLGDHVGESHSTAVRSIVDSVEHTERMLDDVLEFLRGSQTGRVQITRRRTNLKPVCERVIDSLEGRYPTRSLEFTSDPGVEGEWDPDAIAAMLTRLVVNAIEHGSADGHVRVHLRSLSDEAILEVWNAGEMSVDLPMHRLFEPFVFVRSRRPDAAQGLGLGLCLADAIARAHDGRIDVQSDAWQGTTFRVALPTA